MAKLKLEKLLVIFLIALAVLLRFWGIWRLDLFTYDQARDATYIKRIIVDHDLTLIGPQSSLAGIYLGPAYYYLMALPLWLFRLNPVGIDVVTALGGVAAVYFLFKLLKPLGFWPALMASLAYSVSPLVVELSRRAWNPNLIPLLVIISVSLLGRIFQTNKIKVLPWLALDLGIALQLHYSSALLIPPLLILFWIYRKKIVWERKYLLVAGLLFLFSFLPLIVFNWRHDWVMVRSLLTSFWQTSREAGFSPFTVIKNSIVSFFQLFDALLFCGPALCPAAIFLVYSYQFGLIKMRSELVKISFIFLTLGIVLSRLYPGKLFFFYYVFLFPFPFIIYAYLIKNLTQFKKIRPLLICLYLLLIINSVYRTAMVVFSEPVRTKEDFLSAAGIISQDVVKGQNFNLAAVYNSPGSWQNYYEQGLVRSGIRWDHNAVDYGYFVELAGKRPMSWDNFSQAEILYLIAETEVKEPLNVGFWEISQFSPLRVLSQWQMGNGTVIYKLAK